MSKVYQIPFTKIAKGYYEVVADNEEEAFEKASCGDVIDEYENKTENDFDEAILTDIKVCDDCGEIGVTHVCNDCGKDLCGSCTNDQFENDFCTECCPSLYDDGQRCPHEYPDRRTD